MQRKPPKLGCRTKIKDRRRASLQSTMVVNRQRAILDLTGSLATLGGTAAAGLKQRLAPVLEDGEPMPDVRLLIRLLERLARRSGTDLNDADGDRFLGAMRLRPLQGEIRAARAGLRGEMVEVRKILVGRYGSAHCRRRFGLSERTPRGTADLAREARTLMLRLEHPGLVLPVSDPAGAAPDPRGWAARLRPHLDCLEPLLKELERRRAGSLESAADQRRAIEAYDESYLLVAETAEALMHLAGQPELARHLRRKARKRRREEVPAATPASTRWWAAWVAGGRWLRAFVRDLLRRVGGKKLAPPSPDDAS